MDLIDSFVQYTEGLPSPTIFRLWSAITIVAGAAEKRIFAAIPAYVYPNLYTLLVAPPGVGKTISITPATALWMAAKKLHVSPDNMTKASMMDALGQADRKIILSGGKGLLEYHSMVISCSELGVLISSHDLDFLSALNHIYDNPPAYRETRRASIVKSLEIISPQITILAGTQPGFLTQLLPEQAWTMGFTSRLIMIYAGTCPQVDLFTTPSPDQSLWAEMVLRIQQISEAMGIMRWEPTASKSLTQWARDGLHPIPEHSKLEHYKSRRLIHSVKLAMISAISRSPELIVTLEDVTRGRDWLLEAERYMPDIFRHMSGTSDRQVIQDLHFFMNRHLQQNQGTPLRENLLYGFLSTKVPSDKIAKILEVAERTGVISRMAGTTNFITRPKHEFGME